MRAKSPFTLFLLVLLLAACRRQEVQEMSVLSVTATPTPISTPLPAIPTAIPPGSEDNPLQMAIRPVGPASSARDAVEDFEAAVEAEAGLRLRVVLVERDAEALAALCNSSAGQVTTAWLNGPAYMAARAENCGTPILQVERGSRREASTGETGIIISRKGSNLTTLSSLTGKDFCRLGYEDFYSWLLPSLMLLANGISPLAAPQSVQDYDDIPTLVKAVASGDCDAAGLPERALVEYADEIGSDSEAIAVIATSIPFPYAILTIPPELPLGTRIALADALVAIAKDREQAVTMRTLLGQNALVPASAEDFAELTGFMEKTGLDLAQMGN